MQEEIILTLISILTSALTAITGLGGGMLLIAILPNFLNPSILIPIHASTQLSSNLSRAFLGYKDLYYKAILQYFLGSLIGISISCSFLLYLSFTYIPLLIGIYILLSLWSKRFDNFLKKFDSYYILGALQSGLSLVVGATGAMSMPKLLRDCKEKNQVIVNIAALSAITHFLKIIVFISLGFIFFQYLNLMLCMSFGAILGSYIGTKIRKKMPLVNLIFYMKIFLSIFAVKSILTLLI